MTELETEVAIVLLENIRSTVYANDGTKATVPGVPVAHAASAYRDFADACRITQQIRIMEAETS